MLLSSANGNADCDPRIRRVPLPEHNHWLPADMAAGLAAIVQGQFPAVWYQFAVSLPAGMTTGGRAWKACAIAVPLSSRKSRTGFPDHKPAMSSRRNSIQAGSPVAYCAGKSSSTGWPALDQSMRGPAPLWAFEICLPLGVRHRHPTTVHPVHRALPRNGPLLPSRDSNLQARDWSRGTSQALVCRGCGTRCPGLQKEAPKGNSANWRIAKLVPQHSGSPPGNPCRGQYSDGGPSPARRCPGHLHQPMVYPRDNAAMLPPTSAR